MGRSYTRPELLELSKTYLQWVMGFPSWPWLNIPFTPFGNAMRARQVRPSWFGGFSPKPNTHSVCGFGKRGPSFQEAPPYTCTYLSAAERDACVANPNNAFAAAADQPADEPLLLLLLLAVRAWASQLSFFLFLFFA